MLPHSFWALSLIRTQNTATAVWTVTSECPETAVKAFLNVPLGSCLTSTNDSFPEGRAISHHLWSFLQILWFGCCLYSVLWQQHSCLWWVNLWRRRAVLFCVSEIGVLLLTAQSVSASQTPPAPMHTLCKPDCYHSESKSSGRTSLRQSIISWINGLLKCLAQLSWRAMEDSRSWPTQTQGREDMPFW